MFYKKVLKTFEAVYAKGIYVTCLNFEQPIHSSIDIDKKRGKTSKVIAYLPMFSYITISSHPHPHALLEVAKN